MKIEKNIPLQEKRGRCGKFSETIEAMQEGDSVFVDTFKDAVALSNSIARKHALGKGAIRAQRDGGYRVWRVS
jgi:hypothetical protein